MNDDYFETNSTGHKIFVDEPELGKTVLDFPNYINTLSGIIESSTPRYTIGIFGEWGTGKTTLMKNIFTNLKNKGCNCMEFNAWRFEGEKRIATYPMMLSIIENLLKTEQVVSGFQEKNNAEKESLGKKIFRILKGISISANEGITGAGIGVSIDPEKMKREFDHVTFDDVEDFVDENKPALLEGIELIRDDILPLIRGIEQNEDLKLIVFVDDLDRCTPEKAAEIFESIKVFFDLKGIVFVLGLSKDIVEAAIDSKYQYFVERGIFTGADYIKKIIQVPFVLPKWTPEDLSTYLEFLLEEHGDPKFKAFFQKYQKVISDAVDNNPREIKRLLNNFLLARHIFDKDAKKYSDEESEEHNPYNQKLLLIQSLSIKWRWIVDENIKDQSSLDQLNKILDTISLTPGKPPDWSGQSTFGKDTPTLATKIMKDNELLKFLKEHCSPILQMTFNDWENFRRTTAVELDIGPISENLTKPKTRKIVNNSNVNVEELIDKVVPLVKEPRNFILENPRPIGIFNGTEKRKWEGTLRIKLDDLATELRRLSSSFESLSQYDEKLFGLVFERMVQASGREDVILDILDKFRSDMGSYKY